MRTKKKSISSNFRVKECTVCWAASEFRATQGSPTIPGKVFITATNLHVSRTGYNEGAAFSSGSDFMLQLSFPWLQRLIHLNPHSCFSIVPLFYSTISALMWLQAESGYHTQANDPFFHEVLRGGMGFHNQTGALFSTACVPLMCFHP